MKSHRYLPIQTEGKVHAECTHCETRQHALQRNCIVLHFYVSVRYGFSTHQWQASSSATTLCVDVMAHGSMHFFLSKTGYDFYIDHVSMCDCHSIQALWFKKSCIKYVMTAIDQLFSNIKIELWLYPNTSVCCNIILMNLNLLFVVIHHWRLSEHAIPEPGAPPNHMVNHVKVGRMKEDQYCPHPRTLANAVILHLKRNK